MRTICKAGTALATAFVVACAPPASNDAAMADSAARADVPTPDPVPPPTSDSVVSTNATVRRIDVEGGCWVLDDGTTRVQPVELADSLKVDGLDVYVVYRPAPGMLSICQVAPLVRVDTIRRR